MAGRLFPSSLPLSLSLSTVLPVSITILGFSLLRNLPRASRPMRKRYDWRRYTTLSPPLPLFPSLCLSLVLFAQTVSLLSFDRIWISRYKLSLPILPRIWPLEIVRRKRIPFSSVRTLSALENFWVYVSRCHSVARRVYREISIIFVYRSPISTLQN